MTRDATPSKSQLARVTAALRKQVMVLKAISFALVGVINAAVNYSIFWLGLRFLDGNAPVTATLKTAAGHFGIGLENASVIVANVVAWIVAVSGSYVMNSLVTFAAESGRKLTMRAYLTFAASGLLGLLADTTTLLIASKYLPIMLAKLVSIGAGFVVNFSMSHFVVFRPRKF